MCLIDGSKRIENQGQEEKHQGLGAPHLKQLRFEAKQTHPHELHFQSPGSILPPAAGDSRWPAPGAGLAAGSVSKSIMILWTIFSSVLDRVSCGLTILRWSRRSRRPLSCFTSTPVLGAASSASQLSTTICVSQGCHLGRGHLSHFASDLHSRVHAVGLACAPDTSGAQETLRQKRTAGQDKHAARSERASTRARPYSTDAAHEFGHQRGGARRARWWWRHARTPWPS